MDNSRAALCSKGARFIKMKDEVPYGCLNSENVTWLLGEFIWKAVD